MKYRRLGKSELNVSVVGVGTWQLGGEWAKTFDQGEVDAMFDEARRVGINLIDTAECYGDHLSERLIGGAIEKDRDQWIVATKFGHKFNEVFDREDAFDAASVQQQLEDSLKALRTDYVDLYQFHSGTDDVFDSDELWSMLTKQVEAGKVRHLGVSIRGGGSPHQVERASAVGASVFQVIYNRLDQRPAENGTFDTALKEDIGVLARVPLASGFLSGRYKRGDAFAAGDVREQWYKDGRDEKLAQVQRIAETEATPGVPLAQWALAWCLLHPAVTSVIPGCKDVVQVADNAAAAELDMVATDHPQAAEIDR